MKFEQIEALLSDSKNWYHVIDEDIFLHKNDIFFKMIVGPTKLADKLADNIENFHNRLKDKQTSNVIHVMNIEFKYLDQTLRNVSLFKFYGKLAAREDEYQTIYFAKPVHKHSDETIEDPFCLSLINLMNNPQGLLVLEQVIGSIK